MFGSKRRVEIVFKNGHKTEIFATNKEIKEIMDAVNTNKEFLWSNNLNHQSGHIINTKEISSIDWK